MGQTMNSRKKVVKVGSIEVSKACLHRVGNRLFVMSKLFNCLYDIDDPENPRLLSTFKLSGQDSDPVTFMGKVEDKAYFSIGYKTIEVVDFKDESGPRSVGVIRDVLIGARWAFLPDNFIITNLKRPVIYKMSSSSGMKVVYEFPHDSTDFVVLENKLIYATLRDGLKVYDISLPAKPLLVSQLEISAVKLAEKDSNHIFAEGVDGNIYILNVSRFERIEIVAKIAIPGPIASNSIISLNRRLLVRYMWKVAGDRMLAFDLTHIQHPKKVFELTTTNTPLYLATPQTIVFAGIEGWDGVASTTNLSKSLYRIICIESEAFRHVEDIEIEGIWFGSIIIAGSILYIARPQEIALYKIV